MPRSYVTLSPDLVEFADAAADYLEAEGYRVSVEPRGLYYPNTPTLVGKKGATEFVIEVSSVAEPVRYGDWVYYGRARGKETFVALVLPNGTNVSTEELARLRSQGIGVCTSTVAGLTVLVEAIDLSTSIGLPDLSREKAALRKLLRPPFKKISDGAVVDGFKDAAGAFEDLARAHLTKGVVSTRVKFVTPSGNPRFLTSQQISKQTLGQLGVSYSEIIAPTQADDLVRRAIESILKDRNDATHRGGKPAVVRRIKKNVAKHVFAILNAMREIV